MKSSVALWFVQPRPVTSSHVEMNQFALEGAASSSFLRNCTKSYKTQKMRWNYWTLLVDTFCSGEVVGGWGRRNASRRRCCPTVRHSAPIQQSFTCRFPGAEIGWDTGSRAEVELGLGEVCERNCWLFLAFVAQWDHLVIRRSSCCLVLGDIGMCSSQQTLTAHM